jgi:LmbE family N-acetylglucosaminyl deacetylase
MWVMGGPTSNHFVDITDRLALKVEALKAHDSQTAHMDDLEERITMWMRAAAERGGLPEGRLAEGFLVTHVP